MDRGAWQATVHGVSRVGHNLATTPHSLGYRLLLVKGEVSPSIVFIASPFSITRASLIAQLVKNLPIKQETLIRSLGQEGPLEKEMATLVLLPRKFHGQGSLVGYSQWC